MTVSPATPVEFALYVVERLRAAGFEALWAGGCVRDQLLGREPKDYDVATNATPEQVVDLFGKRNSVPVGASFGVIMLLGPARSCGQVEVATFRTDGQYVDGRRPQSVQFCSPEEDAKRRDFTINGMFFDPIENAVIDYVGGQTDLRSGIIRAIGTAADRFAEDKLRMLRAVRFAVYFGFEIETKTADAIKAYAQHLSQVSVERIAQETRRMLQDESRANAVGQLQNLGLLRVIFPLLADRTVANAISVCRHLELPHFEPAFVSLLLPLYDEEVVQNRDRSKQIRQECRRLKLSNDEADTICWLADSVKVTRGVQSLADHVVKPILADRRAPMLIDLLNAISKLHVERVPDVDYLKQFLASHSPGDLSPEPFVSGADLKAMNVQPGPVFKQILSEIRNAQLDGIISDRTAALSRIREMLGNSASLN